MKLSHRSGYYITSANDNCSSVRHSLTYIDCSDTKCMLDTDDPIDTTGGGPYIEKKCDPCSTANTSTDTIGEFAATYSGFKSRRGSLKVCKVHSISGPLSASGTTRLASPQGSMRALIFAPTADRRTQQQTNLNDKYDAGHLVGLQYGGPDDVRNLVPMVKAINQSPGPWYQMETYIAGCLAGCSKDASMTVLDDYPNSAPRDIRCYIPNQITVSVTMRGKTERHTFGNSKSDVEPAWVTGNGFHC